jgi:HD-GYP domain-containing protein (c-di-GMP phosphodiesterase class II)
MGKPAKPQLIEIRPGAAKDLHVPDATLRSVPEWALVLSETLLASLRERDPYTYGHCRRVARLSRLLAKAAGLNEHQQKVIEYSSLFHDLGKIGIPDRVLNKPGRLDAEEEAIIRLHPTKSVEIIRPLCGDPFFGSLVPGIQYHHERIDGLGYPHGIKGEKVPIEARIILIADTFDAMTTTRSYRKGLPIEIAFKELRLFANRQFDAHLVEIFIKAYPTWGLAEEEITEEFVTARFKRAA